MGGDVNKIAKSSNGPALKGSFCHYLNADYISPNWRCTLCSLHSGAKNLNVFLAFPFHFFFLPFSFEGAWRAVAHGACGVLNFVLNRPFIAGKFSLRAPNKLPHYPPLQKYHTTTCTKLPYYPHQRYQTTRTELPQPPPKHHTTSTKHIIMYLQKSTTRDPTNTINSAGRNSNTGGQNRKGGDIAGGGGGEAVGGVRASAADFLLLLFLGTPAKCSLGWRRSSWRTTCSCTRLTLLPSNSPPASSENTCKMQLWVSSSSPYSSHTYFCLKHLILQIFGV